MDDDHENQELWWDELQALRAHVATLEAQVAGCEQREALLLQRQSELESLLETSHDLANVLAVDQLLEVITVRVTELLESDECVLFQLLPDGETLEAIFALGPYAEWIRGAQMHITQGLAGIVMRTGEPLLMNDAHDDPRGMRIPPADGAITPSHVMIAPLIAHGRKIGVMVLNRVPGRPFTQRNLDIFVAFAQHVAIALENARLYADIQRYTNELEQHVEERTAELRHRKDEVEAIINCVADGLLIAARDGTIVSVNPAMANMLGIHPRALIGVNALSQANTASPVIRDRVREAWLHVNRGSPYRIELPITRADGSHFDADMHVSPLVDDQQQVHGFVVVTRDMTAMKDLQRMKDDFVTNVTHELRTPITSLKLRYDLIRVAPQRLNEHLTVLYRETDRLSHIIDDLLTLARIDQERTEFNLRQLDLTLLAHQYVADRQPVAQQRGLKLCFTEGPELAPVNADAGLLGQAIGIVLTNALNYTPPGGTVEVQTDRCTTENSEWAGVMIADSGPGISESEHARLFTRFFRGTAAHAARVAGTGLGLSIAKEIVERHGGWIEARNRPEGDGAIFTIWLPV